MAKYQSLNYYLTRPWTYTIETSHEKTTPRYIICVNELPGVCTDGTTLDDAMKSAQEAMIATFQAYMKNDETIPEPIDAKQFKGKIAYRTSSQRHFRISKEARKRGTSLSQLLDTLVDSALPNDNATSA